MGTRPINILVAIVTSSRVIYHLFLKPYLLSFSFKPRDGNKIVTEKYSMQFGWNSDTIKEQNNSENFGNKKHAEKNWFSYFPDTPIFI
ncbi:hypothetical protein M0804_010901 [Polistes exclamans]|nr:hypothetical protein M0804_010901 [Polistes exclamans]